MKYGIIFDVDGTLWDATGCLVEGWNEAFRKRGIPPVTREYVASFMGLTAPQIAKGVFPEMELEQSQPILAEAAQLGRERIRTHGADLFPHERETLELLSRDYVLCILTNARNNYIELLFDTTGFRDLFTDWVSHGENGLNKTENIRLLMERNHLDNAAYVGDTHGDQMYSDAVPVPFIFAAFGHGQAVDPQYTAHTFDEIPALAEKIFHK